MKRKAITKGATAGATPIPVRFGTNERPLLKLLQARAAAQSRSVSGQLKRNAVEVLDVGPHENFDRELKKYRDAG
jgi:hypothetical protein